MARRRNNAPSKYISPEGHYARRQAALWLSRLLGAGAPLCQELFDNVDARSDAVDVPRRDTEGLRHGIAIGA